MLMYRICKAEFAMQLKGSGYAGRWNEEGQFVLYASATRSLAALELLARRNGGLFTIPYKVMILDVGINSSLKMLPEALPSSWKQVSSYGALRKVGSDWYQGAEKLVLEVPSVLVPQECNFLVNTKHPDFETQVRLVSVEDFEWDPRLV